MKAQELRIGNYVKDPYDKEIRILSLEDANMLRPIPLTEEWLLKLRGEITLYMNYIDFGCFEVYKSMNGWTVEKEGLILTELKHVHQLQNLYFALTNEELTI